MSDQKCLIAEYPTREKFSTALEVLNTSDFTQSEVSTVLHSSDHPSELRNVEDTTPGSPPAEKTMAASTVAGGTLGAAVGAMTMVGPLLVAGPILGMAAGAIGGSLLSLVESWGVEPDVANDYEEKVRSGSCLVIVSGDEMRLREAEQLLMTVGPASINHFKVAK